MSGGRKIAAELAASRAQIERLTAIVEGQARTLARMAARDTLPPSRTITLRELFDRYQVARRHEHSWRWVRNRLVPLVRRLGELPAGELTPPTWAEHRAARGAEATRRERPPAAHTLNIELARAKEMLTFAVQAKLLPANPLAEAKPERTISARETWLAEADVAALLRCCEPTLRAFVLLSVDTGLRFNEARGLRRDWVRDDGIVVLPRRRTKSRKSRMVALTPRASAAREALPEVEGSPFYFVNPSTGALFSEGAIRQWFRNACVRSGVDSHAAEGERVVPHVLRHTAAQAALRRGASVSSVQRMLGHSSLQTTARYLHQDDADVLRVGRLMAAGAAAEMSGDIDGGGGEMSSISRAPRVTPPMDNTPAPGVGR